jgi:hypothetical protein
MIEGGIHLTSPDSQPITGFKLFYNSERVFQIDARAGGTFTTAIGTPLQWQVLSGTFPTPARELEVYGFKPNPEFPGFSIAALYALDAIEITTIPEPSTVALLGLGLAALWWRSRKK